MLDGPHFCMLHMSFLHLVTNFLICIFLVADKNGHSSSLQKWGFQIVTDVTYPKRNGNLYDKVSFVQLLHTN